VHKLLARKLNFILILFVTLLSSVVLNGCGGSSNSNDPVVIDPPIVTPDTPSTNLNQFSFLRSHNPSLSSDVYLDINDNVVTGTVPADADIENLVATFVHNGDEVVVSDVSDITNVVQSSNTTVNNFTHIVTYTIKTNTGDQESYQIDLTKFTGLPIVYLTTDNNADIVSKDDYTPGAVSLDGGRNNNNLSSTVMKIRGRGNSTWDHPKKPFQMKFDDKTEFLGMPADKKWLFLAEYSDKTLLRNTIAFEMGYISHLDWTPASAFAEVYINNEYNGTYNITQKVEESDNRVALGDTGYLLEIDQLERLDADDVYFYTNDFLINVKEPSLDLGSTEFNYISDLINTFESVLHSDQFANVISGYANYIDIDSFIDWYLISEITKNVDSKSFSSIYLNVIPGEKIKMGPLWDFDLSFGNVDYADSQYAQGFWIKDHPWYARLFQDANFVAKIKERFAYFRNNQSFILNKINQHAENLQLAAQENDNKWQTIGVYVWPNPVVFNTYDEEVTHLTNWYTTRMDWLETALNNL
jgi:hypothetical protein